MKRIIFLIILSISVVLTADTHQFGMEIMIIITLIYSLVLIRSNVEKDKANLELKENKDKLQLILNSTAEAIYGMDVDGNCTFCNASFLKILGYKHPKELIGKNVHYQIHHSYKDGTPMLIEDCKIVSSLKVGKCINVNDEVFWRADGTCFDVEYNSYPQFKDGVLIGAVVTFIDITERKKVDDEIKYLSYHDSLTGLYNRMFFDVELKRLDVERNLPISIIMGDANGLKLTNDIFGHTAGDALLKKVAEVFKRVCRADDIISRTGGDEFIVLLPKTEALEAEKIINRVKTELSKEQVHAIKGSISMGSYTKVSLEEDILSIISEAEEVMYDEKTLNRKTNNTNQIKTIIETLHKNSPREEMHSENVSKLSVKIGEVMQLNPVEIRILKDAGYLHDIGKIVLDIETLNKNYDDLSEQEHKKVKQHSVVGYRILNSFDETLDLAESVLAHHENWDGSGFPKGLEGNDIPRLSRIIAVAENYDSLTNNKCEKKISKENALNEIKNQSGVKFDPEIVDIFIEMMNN